MYQWLIFPLEHNKKVTRKIGKTFLQETLKTLLPKKNTSSPFDDFYNALSDHHNELEKAFSSFDSGKDIYEDQCDNVIKELNAIFRNIEHFKQEFL